MNSVTDVIGYLKQRRRRFRYLRKLGRWWWWMWANMLLSDLPLLGGLFIRLAGWPLGAFRSKRILARVKTYVSPRAQVDCAELQIGSNCFIDDYVTIYGQDGSIVLEKQVHLYRGTIVEVGQGGRVVIGADTHVQPGCTLNGYLRQIRIGRNVMIAPGCGLTPYQHRLDDLTRPMSRQDLTSKGDILIEDDVWLGMGVKVMDGVRIGRGAVVGANAVVTGDIPPYSIAAGVPARVIGHRAQRDPSSA